MENWTTNLGQMKPIRFASNRVRIVFKVILTKSKGHIRIPLMILGKIELSWVSFRSRNYVRCYECYKPFGNKIFSSRLNPKKQK